MQTVADILLAAAARTPRAAALVDGTSMLSYEALLAAARRLVSGFDGLGLGHGDRLVVVLQNRAEMAIVHWACQLAGIVVTPVNWRVNGAELDYFLTDSGASALLFEDATCRSVAASTRAGHLIRIGIGAAPGATVTIDALLASVPAQSLPRARVEDISVLLYTSGTTGPGKGVPRSHRAERAAAIAHVAQNALLAGERTLGAMPLYHTMGVRLLLAMGLVNGSFICQRRFDPADALRLIAAHRISSLYLVPTLYHDLVSHAEFAHADLTSVRKLGFAGAPMTEGLLRRLDQAFAPELFVNHYGSSEIYTFTVDQHAAAKPGSAGRAGLNAEVRVIRLGVTDPDDTVSPGEDGQVISRLSSDEAFAGYWHRPAADRDALVDGWYLTGDVGHFDEAGDLFVTGRVDSMMITGGENVLPSEVESVLLRHPAVAEVAVAGLPDERLGHRITAFVRRAAAVSADELDAWCRGSTLATFKRPRTYVFVRMIPKSPVGKILRRLLVAGRYEAE